MINTRTIHSHLPLLFFRINLYGRYFQARINELRSLVSLASLSFIESTTLLRINHLQNGTPHRSIRCRCFTFPRSLPLHLSLGHSPSSLFRRPTQMVSSHLRTFQRTSMAPLLSVQPRLPQLPMPRHRIGTSTRSFRSSPTVS